jgi:hypothetical protein
MNSQNEQFVIVHRLKEEKNSYLTRVTERVPPPMASGAKIWATCRWLNGMRATTV